MDDMDIDNFIDTYILYEENASFNKKIADQENGVVNMDIDRDYIGVKKEKLQKFDQQNEEISQDNISNMTQIEIKQSFTPMTSQNMQVQQDQVMKEHHYEYDKIECLINVNDQVAQLETQLASIKLYNREEHEQEDSNRFLKDLTSLNSFYKISSNNKNEENKFNPLTENDRWSSDWSNPTSNSITNINNKVRKKGKKKFTTYQKQLKILRNKQKITKRESADNSIYAR